MYLCEQEKWKGAELFLLPVHILKRVLKWINSNSKIIYCKYCLKENEGNLGLVEGNGVSMACEVFSCFLIDLSQPHFLSQVTGIFV